MHSTIFTIKSNALGMVSTAMAAYAARILLQYPELMIVDVSRYHRLAITMISSDDLPLMA